MEAILAVFRLVHRKTERFEEAAHHHPILLQIIHHQHAERSLASEAPIAVHCRHGLLDVGLFIGGDHLRRRLYHERAALSFDAGHLQPPAHRLGEAA